MSNCKSWRPCVSGDEFVNKAQASAWALVMAVRNASGLVMGKNLSDWSCFVRSVMDV